MTMRVQSASPTSTTETRRARIGWIITGLLALFLLADGIMRVLEVDQYAEGTLDAGFLPVHGQWIGAALIVSTLLYLYPRLSFFGAILLSAYFGGAIATQIRTELYGSIVFAIGFAVLVWVGLALRDGRVRNLIA